MDRSPPRRILLLGPSGSGKTHLAIELGRLLNIEPIHLDAHFWKPGWISTPQPQWRTIVAELIRKPSWIIDGMYESTLDLRIPAADTVIIIQCSRLACLWGIFVRRLTSGASRRDAPPGQKLDRAFLKYIWRYPAVTRPLLLQRLHEFGQGKQILWLQGRKGVRRFLQEAQHAWAAEVHHASNQA